MLLAVFDQLASSIMVQSIFDWSLQMRKCSLLHFIKFLGYLDNSARNGKVKMAMRNATSAQFMHFLCCYYPPGRHLERPEPPRDFQEAVSPFFLFCFVFTLHLAGLLSDKVLEGTFRNWPTFCIFSVVIMLLAGTLRDQNLKGISRNWSLHFYFYDVFTFHLAAFLRDWVSL